MIFNPAYLTTKSCLKWAISDSDELSFYQTKCAPGSWPIACRQKDTISSKGFGEYPPSKISKIFKFDFDKVEC